MSKNKMNNKSILKGLRVFSTIAVVFMVAVSGFGQVSLPTLGAPVVENFDTLANTGTTNTAVPVGWAFAETGSGANTTYAAGTGSGNGGNTYSFGSVALPTDRAFGGLQSGSVVPTVGGAFVNNTGSAITLLTISYAGEQWRLGTAARLDQLDFQYSTDATSLTTGTWIDRNSLDFVAPITAGTLGAFDGNVTANRTVVNGSIDNLNVANGATIWIRWNDFGATGADDGLGVDDFSITPSNPIEITTANSMPNGSTGIAYTTSLVGAGGVGPYTFAVAAGAVPTGLTLNTDGTWSGLPTVAATYNFDVTITDSNPFSFAKSSLVPNTKTESFSIIIAAPSAATAAVRGRLVSTFNRSLANANVSITNTASGEVRYSRSNQLGYFNFQELEVGNIYVIEVNSKRFRFENHTFTLNEDLTDLVLTAQ